MTTLTEDQAIDLIEDDGPEELEPDSTDIGPGGTVKLNDLYRVLFLELKRVNRKNPDRRFMLPELERDDLAVTRQMIQRAISSPGTKSKPTSKTFVI